MFKNVRLALWVGSLMFGAQALAATPGAVGGMPDLTGYTRCSIQDPAPAPGASCHDCDHDGVFHWIDAGCRCSFGKVVCDQPSNQIQFQNTVEEDPDAWVFRFHSPGIR